MKKVVMLLCIFMIAGVLAQKHADAGGVTYFDVVKGDVVRGADGLWESAGFQVTTKNGKISIPVRSVKVAFVRNSESVILDVDFSTIEINKRENEYFINLRDLQFHEDFSLIIKLDISELVSGSKNGSDSGPGPIPNETVLVIKYP